VACCLNGVVGELPSQAVYSSCDLVRHFHERSLETFVNLALAFWPNDIVRLERVHVSDPVFCRN
jgi:hypothetical protein